MTQIANTNTCPRDPHMETNLRCGRCGELICPRCMVQSPVGARCPECARIGRSAMFQVSSTDFGRTLFAGLVAAVVMAGAMVAFLWVLGQFPIQLSLSVIAGQLAVGYFVGEAVRRGSGYKVDKRLPYVAGVMAFLSYLLAAGIMATVFDNGFLIASFWSLIGLALSVYVAMGRVRP